MPRVLAGLAHPEIDVRLLAGQEQQPVVGEPLARKIEPTALSGRRLTVSLLDPAWKRPVEDTLPELEKKLAQELPEIRPRVTLR